MEGIGNFSSKSLYALRDVCLKCSAKRIIDTENDGPPVGLQSCLCLIRQIKLVDF